jgi:hypothetical protein
MIYRRTPPEAGQTAAAGQIGPPWRQHDRVAIRKDGPDKSFGPRYLRVLRASPSFICAKILPSRCSKQSEQLHSGTQSRRKIAARTSPDQRLVSAIIHFDLAQRLLTPMCMQLPCIQTSCSTIYPQDVATD